MLRNTNTQSITQSQDIQRIAFATGYLKGNFLKSDRCSFVKLASVLNLFKAIEELNNLPSSVISNENLPNISREKIASFLTEFVNDSSLSGAMYLCEIIFSNIWISFNNKLTLSETGDIVYQEIINNLGENGSKALPLFHVTNQEASTAIEIISIERWKDFFKNQNIPTQDQDKDCAEIINAILSSHNSQIFEWVNKISVNHPGNRNALSSLTNLIKIIVLSYRRINTTSELIKPEAYTDKLYFYEAIVAYLIALGYSFNNAIDFIIDTVKPYLSNADEKSFYDYINKIKQKHIDNTMLKLEIANPIDISLSEQSIIDFLNGRYNRNLQLIDCYILFQQLKLIEVNSLSEMRLANIKVLSNWVNEANGENREEVAKQREARRKASDIIINCNIKRDNAIGLDNLGLDELPPFNKLTGMENIERLNLNSNKISNIAKERINKLSNLKFLYLANNLISCLDSEVFVDNTSLNTINLAYNNISKLGANVFGSECRSIFLGHNRLGDLSEEAFGLFNKLDKLNLAGNKEARLSDGEFLKLIDKSGIDLVKNIIIPRESVLALYLHSNNNQILKFIENKYLLDDLVKYQGIGSLIVNKSLIEYKLLSRVAKGEVEISKTGLGLDFFVELFNKGQLSLADLVFNNFEYFIQRPDGEKAIQSVLNNNRLYVPLSKEHLKISITLELQENLIQLLCDRQISGSSANHIISPTAKIERRDIEKFIGKLAVKNENERQLKNSIEMEIVAIIAQNSISDVWEEMQKFTSQQKMDCMKPLVALLYDLNDNQIANQQTIADYICNSFVGYFNSEWIKQQIIDNAQVLAIKIATINKNRILLGWLIDRIGSKRSKQLNHPEVQEKVLTAINSYDFKQRNISQLINKDWQQKLKLINAKFKALSEEDQGVSGGCPD